MPSRRNLLWLKCGPLLAINKCNQRGRYDRTKSNQSNPFKLRASSSPPPPTHTRTPSRDESRSRQLPLSPRACSLGRQQWELLTHAPTVLYCPSVAHCSRGQAMFLTSTTVNRCFWHGQPTNNVFDINIKQTMFLTLVVVEICFWHRCTTKWCFWLLEVFINRYPRRSSATSHRSEDESVFGWMTLSYTYSGDWSCVNLYCRSYTFFSWQSGAAAGDYTSGSPRWLKVVSKTIKQSYR